MRPPIVIELISLHIPKTAGTTFQDRLRAAYGPDGLALDYGDKPTSPTSLFQSDFERWQAGTASAAAALSTFSAVHGHFWAGKYFPHFPQARKVLWLRDPAKRVVSLYHFWKTPDPGDEHPTRQLLIREKLSLLEFAELTNIRNQITQYFVRGYPPEAFDFIGFQETFAQDLDAFCDMMRWPREAAPLINATPGEEYAAATSDTSALAQIRRWNREDVEWYEAAASLRRPPA